MSLIWVEASIASWYVLLVMISRNLPIGLQCMHILTMRGHLIRMNGSMVSYLLLKKLWEPGYWAMRQVVRAKSFTCFTLHRLVRFCLLVLVFFWGGFVCLVLFGLARWPICATVLSIDDYFSITPWLPLLSQRAQQSPKKKDVRDDPMRGQ